MAKSGKYQFKYIGDPNDGLSGPPSIDYEGQTFVKGEVTPVEVDEDDEESMDRLRKLQGHSHFVDMSDKDAANDAAQQQKDLEAQAKEQEKREEAQRKADEKDEEQRQANLAKQAKRGGLTAARAPRPPGKVTRPAPGDPFQGRTVEERTPVEDHTKAGKTKK